MNKLLPFVMVSVLAACSSSNDSMPFQPHTAPATAMGATELHHPMAEPQQTAAHADANAYVVHLQTALQAKHYYHGRIDGRCGAGTRSAIAVYQHDLNVPVTHDAGCHVGGKTWQGLGLSPGGEQH